MKNKTLKQANALMALALFGSSAFATADKDLLDILMKNGALSKDQYNAMAGKEGMASAELLQALAKNGVITKAQYDSLNKKVPAKAEAPKTAVAANEAAGKSAEHEKDSAHVKLGEKGIEFETADGNFKASFGGRIQVDSQTNLNQSGAANPNPNLDARLNDGLGFRRARMHMEGTMFKSFDYKFEYDFVRAAGNSVAPPNGGAVPSIPASAGITDAFISYTGFKPFSITVGQFKEPFSLESVTSNRYLTFIERSLPNNAFIESENPYKLGISGEGYGQRWTARGAFMTESIAGNSASVSSLTYNNANRNSVGAGDSSWEFIGRATFLPYYNGPTELIHLGAAGSYRHINNKYNQTGALTTNPYVFSAQPDTNFDRTAWASTGALTVVNAAGQKVRELSSFSRFGAELAGVYGPFSAQAEYMQADLSGIGYTNSDVLSGWYAYASYFLTGESRNYNTKAGKFDRLKPAQNFDLNGGWGAWEVAARFDELDMNAPHVNTNTSGVSFGGGRLQNGTLALNWYLNSHVRFMTNWVHVFNSHNYVNPLGTGINAANANIGKYNGQNPDIIETRVQIDW